MTRAEIRDGVLRALAKVAPEVRGQPPDPRASLRDQLDLDSMDLLNFVIALHGEFQVDVPERDYARLETLDALVDYLAGRVTTPPAGPG